MKWQWTPEGSASPSAPWKSTALQGTRLADQRSQEDSHGQVFTICFLRETARQEAAFAGCLWKFGLLASTVFLFFTWSHQNWSRSEFLFFLLLLGKWVYQLNFLLLCILHLPCATLWPLVLLPSCSVIATDFHGSVVLMLIFLTFASKQRLFISIIEIPSLP